MVRRGRLQRPRCLRFLLPNRPTTTFGISASLLVSEFGPWFRGSLEALQVFLSPWSRARARRGRETLSPAALLLPARPTGLRAAASPGIREGGRAGWTGGHGVGRAADRPAGTAWGAPQTPPFALRVGRRQSSTQTDPHLPWFAADLSDFSVFLTWRGGGTSCSTAQ